MRRTRGITPKWVLPLFLLSIGSIFLIQTLSDSPVYADDGTGYPWPNATYVDANYDWGYSTCPANDSGCMTLSGWLSGVKYGEADPWVYYLRNCTSYVAWKINNVFAKDIHGWGNAASFNTSALAASYTDDSSPRPGDIAQWNGTGGNPYGHVAYVLSVTSGIATYAQFNYAGDGNFTNTYTSAGGSQGAPSHYIHIQDVTPPPPAGGIPSSAVISFNSSENVFARGTDNQSYVNSWGSSWSGFNLMQNGAIFAGNPTGVQYGSEGKVFVRGVNNEIYESTWNGSAWGGFGTLQLGATFASDPVAVQFAPSVLNVFAIGTDNQMYEISKAPGWGTFSLVQSGALFTGNPTVVRFNGNEYVGARGIDNQMYVDTWTSGSGWSGFTNLSPGATFASDPTVFQFGNVLNVFARGTDNQMYVNYLDTSWHPFGLIQSGAIFASDPTVAQFGGQEKVFARGVDNQIYENTWNGASWGGFGSLQSGATFAGSPVALQYGTVLNVFARGVDNQMYEITKNPSWGTFVLLQNGAVFNGFSWK